MARLPRRFYVEQLPDAPGEVVLSGATRAHLNIVRMRQGDAIIVFDGGGYEAAGVITSLTAREAVCTLSEKRPVPEPSRRVSLVLALSKGSTLDRAVRMATELGVHEVQLCQTEHSVPRLTSTRLKRLQRVASEAARQSQRARVPTLDGVDDLAAAIAAIPPTADRWVFDPSVDRWPAAEDRASSALWVAIGPEGGFSESEFAALKQGGFKVLSLGAGVLRVETAVAASLAMAQLLANAAESSIDRNRSGQGR